MLKEVSAGASVYFGEAGAYPAFLGVSLAIHFTVRIFMMMNRMARGIATTKAMVFHVFKGALIAIRVRGKAARMTHHINRRIGEGLPWLSSW